MSTVADDMVVSLDYTLRLEDGEVVDSSNGREPLVFVQGQGAIIPGLEKALYGMVAGEAKEVVVEPGEGYGEFDPELFETLPRSIFPADLVLEEGMGFRMRADSGEVVVAYIDRIENDQVTVDLNHPLAGEKLFFQVQVVGVREATPEDLEGCGGACGEDCGCGCDGDCDEDGCCAQ